MPLSCLMGNLSFEGDMSYTFPSECVKIEKLLEYTFQFCVGGLIMVLIGLILGGKLPVVTAGGIGMLVYLAMVSAIAYSLWGILIKHNPISKVAVFGFMNPVCGVILSAILLDESSSLGVMSLVSLALVCLGIYIVNRK